MKNTFSILFVLLVAGCASPQSTKPSDAHYVEFDKKSNDLDSYIHKMRKSVDEKLKFLISQSNEKPPKGTFVTVKFKIEATMGNVTDVKIINSNFTKQMSDIFVDAIVSNSPFGAWTPEMINALGDSQDISFTFQYQ